MGERTFKKEKMIAECSDFKLLKWFDNRLGRAPEYTSCGFVTWCVKWPFSTIIFISSYAVVELDLYLSDGQRVNKAFSEGYKYKYFSPTHS